MALYNGQVLLKTLIKDDIEFKKGDAGEVAVDSEDNVYFITSIICYILKGHQRWSYRKESQNCGYKLLFWSGSIRRRSDDV